MGRVPYDSSPQPPRSRLGSPPRPESPCGMQPPPRVMRHPWDAGRDGGSGRSGICVQEENKAGDYRSGASILEVQTPARSPRRSRYRHSCLGGPLLYPPPPPPRNPSSRPRRTTRSSEHAGSHPSPSITRAPSSPRARAPLALSARSTPVPPSAAKAAAPCHPRPARPLSQPGSPASCAATAARDPPPSRLPLSCLFRSTNNFCSDAGSLGPRRPLLPASPPSGYENSKQLADLRADQLWLPPTPAFRSNLAAAASKISLRAGLGGGRDLSGRGCLRSKEPLHAPSSPPK